MEGDASRVSLDLRREVLEAILRLSPDWLARLDKAYHPAIAGLVADEAERIARRTDLLASLADHDRIDLLDAGLSVAGFLLGAADIWLTWGATILGWAGLALGWLALVRMAREISGWQRRREDRMMERRILEEQAEKLERVLASVGQDGEPPSAHECSSG